MKAMTIAHINHPVVTGVTCCRKPHNGIYFKPGQLVVEAVCPECMARVESWIEVGRLPLDTLGLVCVATPTEENQ